MTPSIRRRWRSAASLTIVALLAAAGLAARADAADGQLTLFKHTGSQDYNKYWEPPVNQPASYVSPVNLTAGNAFLKIVVQSKPSSKAMQPQVCFWRHATVQFQYETCSPARFLTVTDEGTYYVNLGRPGGWWKMNDRVNGQAVYDWSKQASVIRIMLKDPVTGSLFLSQKCGAACYKGGDLSQHVPVQFSGELIMTSGSSYSFPADWRSGCPSSWGGGCGGSGGGVTTTTTAATTTTTLPGATTTTTLPGATTTTMPSSSSLKPTVSVVTGDRTFTARWSHASATLFQFRYRPIDETKWNWDDPARTNSRVVNGLTNGQRYTVQVRAYVNKQWQAWASVSATPGS